MRLVDKDARHDDRLTSGADERDEPLSEAERAAEWDDEAWAKRDNEALDGRAGGWK